MQYNTKMTWPNARCWVCSATCRYDLLQHKIPRDVSLIHVLSEVAVVDDAQEISIQDFYLLKFTPYMRQQERLGRNDDAVLSLEKSFSLYPSSIDVINALCKLHLIQVRYSIVYRAHIGRLNHIYGHVSFSPGSILP